jgi:peptide/nickel transport system permease protein
MAQANKVEARGYLKLRRRVWGLETAATFVRRKPLASLGAVVLLVMIILAAGAEVIAPKDPLLMNPGLELEQPTSAHWLGTDQNGRDLLSRIIFGARTSLTVGVGVVIFGTGLAIVVGALSGYLGGRFDMYFQRLVDAFMAVPPLVLLLTIMAALGPGLFNVILALSFRTAISESRVIRGAVISIRENPYVEAAKAIGARDLRIIVRHILPNVFAPAIVIASLTLGGAIIAEASLSFLGYGVPPPAASWGGMISNEARTYMISAPWMALFPGIALAIAVYSINMFGDGLRDVLDPRQRGAGGRFR